MFFFPPVDVPPAIIEVVADPGGFIGMRASQIEWIKRHHNQVRIIGGCNSSCTMYLGLPRDQVCVSPNARFGFHTAYGSTRAGNDAGTRMMLAHYPPFVRAQLHTLSPKLQYLTGASLLPYMRRCP